MSAMAKLEMFNFEPTTEKSRYTESTKMKEDYIETLAYEIDDELSKLMQKYKVSPLSLSSIMLARLMRLCMETNQLDDLKSIMMIARSQEEKKVLQ